MQQIFSFSLCLLLLVAGAAVYAGEGNLQQINSTLFTSGTLSAEQIAALKADGLVTLIDLRQPSEGLDVAQSAAAELGLVYANEAVGRTLPDAQSMDRISAMIEAAAPGKVLLHCASGHRAGMVAALYLQQHGSSSAAALQSAEVAGTRADGLQQLQTYFAQLQAVNE